MDPSAWWTQQLAEFVASVSSCTTETATARVAVERAAEVLDADTAAIMAGGELLAAVGYAEGTEPLGELKRMQPGAPGSQLEVPGVGWCAVAVAGLAYPAGATLVLARRDGLTRQETALLGGMARVAAMRMTMLSVLDHERGAREEVEQLVREQAALRRVATLVAKAVPPEEIFGAVTEELGKLSGADIALMLRYQADDAGTVVGRWSRSEMPDRIIGTQLKVEGAGVTVSVRRTGRPAHADVFAGPPRSAAECLRQAGVQMGNGSPVVVDGRLWGVMIIAATQPDGLRPEVERRIPAFTELVATAIANAQARVELRAIAEEQAALRRVATLVARGALPDEVFAAVAQEVGNVLPAADFAMVARYDPGRSVKVVGGWRRAGGTGLVGRRIPLGGQNVSTLVFERNGPARVDNHLIEGAEPMTATAREIGMRSSAGAPIRVDGRLWGVMVVASTQEHTLPDGTEYQLAEFTKLIAVTIANTQAREEVRTLADEQAALRRVATLVARGEPPRRVFAAVAQEAGLLLRADLTLIGRYEEGTVTGVAGWSATGEPVPTRSQVSLGGRNVTEMVRSTKRPARLDSYADASGDVAADARDRGISSSVGAPISVEGRLWGVMVAASIHGQLLPPSTEGRLADFTGLVATAIANAEVNAELRASRARIVATADQTRRRIERDLHDGAQQRLVTLALQVRAAQAKVPAQLEKLTADLDHVAAGLSSTLDELREFARGIHPAILAKGGLAPALKMLVRRSSVRVTLDMQVHERLPEHIEVTAYYVISEALTNAAKHAKASAAHIRVDTASGALRLDVRDDGVGGADPARGSGLIGLRDRVEATGGTFRLKSPHGEGTHLLIELPVRRSG
jgi:signal transduction histidine kinase